MNILFSINSKFIELTKNCIKSIIRYDQDIDFYILHHDLSNDDKNNLINSFKSQTFHFIEIDENEFKDFPISSRYPLEIYYRLFAPLLLPNNLDRILYLDVDIVVINSLKELYNTTLENYSYAACTHISNTMTTMNCIRLNIDLDTPYINTGVLLMNLDELRSSLSKQQILDYANKHKKQLVLFDQDILTALYGKKTKLLDYTKYNLSDRMINFYNMRNPKNKLTLDSIRKNTVIIHYCGRNKPWKDNYLGQLDCFYEELLKAS